MSALGSHYFIELYECEADLGDVEGVRSALVDAAKEAQATIVSVRFHPVDPCGVKGAVIIAESHLAIRTWPEYQAALADIFTCGPVLQPKIAADFLVRRFGAKRFLMEEYPRGVFPGQPGIAHKVPEATAVSVHA